MVPLHSEKEFLSMIMEYATVRRYIIGKLMNRYCLIVAAVVVIPSIECIGQEMPANGKEFKQSVDAMTGLTQNLEAPKHFLKKNAEKHGGEFDVASYFAALNHLAMAPGYTLDYVYRTGFDRQLPVYGKPVLYARLKNKAPYRTYSEFEKERGDPSCIKLEQLKTDKRVLGASLGDAWGGKGVSEEDAEFYKQYKQLENECEKDKAGHEYLEHIKIDDTAIGYLQFVILRIMGRQFYLYWHSNYDDMQIVYDKALVEVVFSPVERLNKSIEQQYLEKIKERPDSPTVQKWMERLPPIKVRLEAVTKAKQEAYKLNFDPVIEFQVDTVRVQIVVFTKWGGFLRKTYTIARKYPHKLLDEKSEVLVSYNWELLM
jgi:hypothetical protein